jgi:hypothetical protein
VSAFPRKTIGALSPTSPDLWGAMSAVVDLAMLGQRPFPIRYSCWSLSADAPAERIQMSGVTRCSVVPWRNSYTKESYTRCGGEALILGNIANLDKSQRMVDLAVLIIRTDVSALRDESQTENFWNSPWNRASI